MARVTFSPLIAGMSGRTADAVFASWKGRNYVRKYVIPHNPQSAAQTLVRESLARCVTLWRSLTAHIKKWLDEYGTDYRMAGYNTFCSKNRALEQVPSALKPVPDNPHVVAPSTLAGAAGAAGEIDVTWVDNAPEDYNQVILLARLVSGAVFEASVEAGAALQAKTLTGLNTGEDYDIYAMWWNNDDEIIGTAVADMAVTAG